ncbi:MAG: DUF4404 family protein [Pedosphaera sp.]|nr:DUF4404 family protein [Pedosphaera sp.]
MQNHRTLSFRPASTTLIPEQPKEQRRMIEHTLTEMEKRLSQSESIQPATRQELLGLIQTLRQEINSLAETHAEDAQSIAGFTTVTAHEATREAKNPALLKLSVDGLESSVSGFEKSHPRLVDAVNRICTTLSNLGI